jgi:hypothetical protein
VSLRDAIANDPTSIGGGSDADARAVGATTALLAFSDNDMVQALMGGMGSARVETAFHSAHFASLAGKFGPLVSRIDEAHSIPTYRLNYHAAVALFYVTLLERPATKRQILLRYGKERLGDARQSPLSYQVIEACAFVAGEVVPAPTPIALMCRMAIVMKVFYQLANYLACARPRPSTAEEEIKGSSFLKSPDGAIRPTYALTIPARKRPREEAAIKTHLLLQFGPTIVNAAHQEGFMLDAPSTLLVSAFLAGGISSRNVSASLAVPGGVVNSEDAMQALKEWAPPYEECQMNNMIFSTIVQNTLLYHTNFNPRGAGAPLLISATLSKIISNNGRWDADLGTTTAPLSTLYSSPIVAQP